MTALASVPDGFGLTGLVEAAFKEEAVTGRVLSERETKDKTVGGIVGIIMAGHMARGMAEPPGGGGFKGVRLPDLGGTETVGGETTSTPTETTSRAKPTDTKPAETQPVETKPVETKPVETKPTDPRPTADTKPADPKPADTKPADTKPPDTKPVEGKEPVDAERSNGSQPIQPKDVPQGLTGEQFDQISALIRSQAGKFGSDISVQGSRAKGTARPDSDIDIAIRVDEPRFNEILHDSFGEPKPGTAHERTMKHAAKTGKIQRGELKLSNLGRQIEALTGIKVDISVIKIGGPFDNPPFIPLR